MQSLFKKSINQMFILNSLSYHICINIEIKIKLILNICESLVLLIQRIGYHFRDQRFRVKCHVLNNFQEFIIYFFGYNSCILEKINENLYKNIKSLFKPVSKYNKIFAFDAPFNGNTKRFLDIFWSKNEIYLHFGYY